jgi:hypothetical protein
MRRLSDKGADLTGARAVHSGSISGMTQVFDYFGVDSASSGASSRPPRT